MRGLVVEDDQDTRSMITHALQLRRERHPGRKRFLSATSIPAGAAVCSAHRHRHAGMDGYRLLETIRSHAFAPFIAVALTAYASPLDKDKTLQSGFQAHVSKPVELPQLLTTVADLLDRRRRKS